MASQPIRHRHRDHSSDSHRNQLFTLTLLALLILVPAAHAQDAPRHVEFVASADHDALLPDGTAAVSQYQIEFFFASAAEPFQVASIGKPLPGADGLVVHDLASTPVAWPVPGATYEVRVCASGPQGEGRSAPSPPFIVGATPNVAPSVLLSAPTHGASYVAPASIALTAMASDTDGSVARVDFYRDATLVASDASAPYSVTATALPAGSYTITATAVDDDGAEASSAPAVVSVTSPAPAAIELRPRGDTYVRGGRYASRNYGTATQLLVRRSSKGDTTYESYLSFDIGTVTAGRPVVLRLAGRLSKNSAPVQAGIYSVADTGWSETATTYTTRPASGATALGTFTVTKTTATVVEVDVTTYVQAERAAGRTRAAFALKGVTSGTVDVAAPSREAATNGPVLVVK